MLLSIYLRYLVATVCATDGVPSSPYRSLQFSAAAARP